MGKGGSKHDFAQNYGALENSPTASVKLSALVRRFSLILLPTKVRFDCSSTTIMGASAEQKEEEEGECMQWRGEGGARGRGGHQSLVWTSLFFSRLMVPELSRRLQTREGRKGGGGGGGEMRIAFAAATIAGDKVRATCRSTHTSLPEGDRHKHLGAHTHNTTT